MRKHTNAHDRNALGMCKGNRFTGRTASITGTGAQVISVQANLKYGGNAGYLLSHGLHAAQREDEPSGTSTPCGTHCGRLHVAEASNMLPANRRERQMSAGARALHLIQTQAPRRAAPRRRLNNPTLLHGRGQQKQQTRMQKDAGIRVQLFICHL